MLRNHPLRHYRALAAHYLSRARVAHNPVLQKILFATASRFQEKASRREHQVASRPADLEQAPRDQIGNRPLNRYLWRTADYWRRALATNDPVLRDVLSTLAGTYQELAARHENHLAKRRMAAEPPGAARKRRTRAILARTPFLRRRGKGVS